MLNHFLTDRKQYQNIIQIIKNFKCLNMKLKYKSILVTAYIYYRKTQNFSMFSYVL